MPVTQAIPVRAEFAPNTGAASFYLRYGDVSRPLEMTLYNASGGICNLSDLDVVKFEFIPGGVDGIVLERTGAKDGVGTSGKISYTFLTTDFDGSQFGFGRYQFSVKLTYDDGVTLEFPADKHFLMEVRPAAGSSGPASLNRKPTLAVSEVSRYNLSADQTTNLTAGSKILFDRRTAIGEQNIVTLQPDSRIKVSKGFRVRFDLKFAAEFTANTGWVHCAIYDVTNSAVVGTYSPISIPDGGIVLRGEFGGMVVHVEPTVDTTYEVRLVESVSLLEIRSLNTELTATVENKLANLTNSAPSRRLYWGSVASQSAMALLASAKRGDWCYRSDEGKDYELTVEPATTAANWRAYSGSGGSANPTRAVRVVYDGSTPISLGGYTATEILSVHRNALLVDEPNYSLTGGGTTVTPQGSHGWVNTDVIRVVFRATA